MMNRTIGMAASVAVALGAIGCDEVVEPYASHAYAVMKPTAGYEASGHIRLEPLEDGGLRVIAEMEDLSPGLHAFHVHRNGDCGDGARNAGPHYSFLPVAEGETPDRITGDLGELDAGPDGTARLETTVPTADLGGERGVLGRSIVVHERGNDPEVTPDGDAGARIACGVIELAAVGVVPPVANVYP